MGKNRESLVINFSYFFFTASLQIKGLIVIVLHHLDK